jgi:hypothetical protein
MDASTSIFASDDLSSSSTPASSSYPRDTKEGSNTTQLKILISGDYDVNAWAKYTRTQAAALTPAEFVILRAPHHGARARWRDPRDEILSETPDSLPIAIRDNWSLLARSGLREPFFDRLARMAGHRADWRGAGSKALTSASLAQFLAFWMKVKQAASEPEVALMPNGNLQVEWYRNARHHLDVEFTEDGRAFFGLLDGDAVHEGVEALDRLADWLLARPSKPLKWRSA